MVSLSILESYVSVNNISHNFLRVSTSFCQSAKVIKKCVFENYFNSTHTFFFKSLDLKFPAKFFTESQKKETSSKQKTVLHTNDCRFEINLFESIKNCGKIIMFHIDT